MSFILLGILNSQASAGGNPVTYFISTLGGGAETNQFQGAIRDNQGYVYGAGRFDTGSSDEAVIAKFDNEGAIVWQRKISGTRSTYYQAVVTDSAGNAYAVGYENATATASSGIIVKYDTTGTLQWKKRLNSGSYEFVRGLAIDGSDNLYLNMQSISGGIASYDMIILKMDTDGAIVWQRYGSTSQVEQPNGICVDDSGNVYGFAKQDEGTVNQEKGYLWKLNSSGTQQWIRALGNDNKSNIDSVAKLATDGTYVYAVENARIGQPTAGQAQNLWSINASDGSTNWIVRPYTNNATRSEVGQGVDFDSSGNTYWTAYSNLQGTTGTNATIVKLDSSGTLVWERWLGGSGSDYFFGDVKVDDDGNILAAGRSSSINTQDAWIVSLPGDGSLTGTYTIDGSNITYGTAAYVYTGYDATYGVPTNIAGTGWSNGTATIGVSDFTAGTEAASSYTNYYTPL